MSQGGISREETDLTLNEQGLQAVKGFLARILHRDDDPGLQSIRPKNDNSPSPDLWEPPIDNEV
jgi:hypothetical protein